MVPNDWNSPALPGDGGFRRDNIDDREDLVENSLAD
jgi:hypothetical protein